ncbi:MAG: DUF1830 domain-containing protein [Elainellaceae cyanobacterium]
MITSPPKPPSPQGIEDSILCYYVNQSSEIQILRVASGASFYFEKVVFPSERLLFDAPQAALVEIFTQKATAPQIVPCTQLQVREGLEQT